MNDFYFYSETAFHHEGNIAYLKELIIASKQAGVNGVKFQVLTNIADFVSDKHTGYNTLSKYCFTYKEWNEIFQFTCDIGLDIILMPLNVNALALLKDFPVKFIEIHSVSFNDHELQRAVKQTNIDLILGIGGRTEDEIENLRSFFGHQLKVLMVGFQSFPSKLENIKLGKIAILKKYYPELLIGYADHTAYDNEFAILSNEYAYLLGARVFEKHITVTEGVERVDASAAVSSEKIANSVSRLKFITDNILVSKENCFAFSPEEITYRNRQLTCVAARDLAKGEYLSQEDIRLKLLDYRDELYNNIDELVGKVITKNIEINDAISKSDIS